MKLTIYRGTKEIGGSCLELSTDNTILYLDFGLPLVNVDGSRFTDKICFENTYTEMVEKRLAIPVASMLDASDVRNKALLLSHAHGDHYGLIPWLPESIPIFTSLGIKAILDIATLFGQSKIHDRQIEIVTAWKPFMFGDFEITPYLADHSAVDAFSFLIRAEGKTVYYSGDIRAHGRKHKVFDNIIRKPPEKVDVLLIEGSNIGKGEGEEISEQSVEERLAQEFSKSGLYIGAFSSQNIDRFVSFFKACRASNRILVVDPYTAAVLDALREISSNIPQFDWDDSFKIYFAPNSYTQALAASNQLYKFKQTKITWDEILAEKDRIVIKDNYFMRQTLKRKAMLSSATLVYSMWDGYLEEDPFWYASGVEILKIHCSGHIYKNDLVEFINALNPVTIIPNHTFSPELFLDYFGTKVRLLKDGQVLEL